jgi:CubicO group peptidase (beta-lactamase class C family)
MFDDFISETAINQVRAGLLMALLGLAATAIGPGEVSGNQTGPAAESNQTSWQQNRDTTQTFQTSFDRYVHDDSIVGAAYVVVKDGQTIDWHAVGMADRELKQAVDQDTIFHWGSITKTITAVAVLQLRDRHRLSLDDSITKYVPELTRVHTDYGPVSQVTLRQLLSHTAGFQGPTWPYRDDTKPWQPFEPTEWAQLVAMMPYQELAFKPGSKFSYSNPGFIYLARVIEKVSSLSYQTYVKRNILMPLGMTHSYFNLTPVRWASHRSNNYTVTLDANGHKTVTANGREFDTGITTPNGGLNAPLGDLVRWVTFLNGARTTMGPQILSRSSLEEMWRPVMPMDTAPDHREYMGLSFFLDQRAGPAGTIKFIGHTGSQAGFRAFLEFNPINRTAVVAAFNTSHASDHNEAETRAAQQSRDGFNALREQAFALLQ